MKKSLQKNISVKDRIDVESMLDRTVSITRSGPAEWHVKPGPANALEHKCTGWLKIVNPRKAKLIRIVMTWKWAGFSYMDYRKIAYLQAGRSFTVLQGELRAQKATYAFKAPSGVSYLSHVPWYTNEDADLFLHNVCRQSPLCRAHTIGISHQGRPIRALTIGSHKSGKKHIVVVGREHAPETTSSFIIEAIVKYLLSARAPEKLLRKFTFNFLPVANPDGVANGTKNPRPGPDRARDGSDLYYAGMTSKDPTCKAVRDYKIGLRPASLLNYHSYAVIRAPQIIFYDKKKGMRTLDYLLGEPNPRDCSDWLVRRQQEGGNSMDYHLWKRFRTNSVVFEVPWLGRSLKEVEEIGIKSFLSVMAAEST